MAKKRTKLDLLADVLDLIADKLDDLEDKINKSDDSYFGYNYDVLKIKEQIENLRKGKIDE